jgi:hypothetical protein
MKGIVSLCVLTLALVVSMSVAHAGAITFTVDEFGNGSFSGFTGSGTLAPAFIPDPSGGVAGNVLAYALPSGVPSTPGDLILDEPGGSLAPITSDYVRFFTTGGGTHLLIFYSDNGDGVDSPADISGLPTNPSTNLVHVLEVGPEGNNGATYSPTGVQPGAGNTDFVLTFNVISDSTAPEPASLVLMAAGLAGLGLKKYWRR